VTDETLTCDAVATRGLLERYVAGRLSDDQSLGIMEAHLLTCEACREELRIALIVRAESSARSEPKRRAWPLVGAGLALAAGLAALVVVRSGGSASSVRALGAVGQAPLYLGVAVRGGGTPGDSIFDAAMVAYGDGDYTAAAGGLTRALATGVDSAPTLFFLGASELMSDRPDEAATAFRRVIALGETPYLAEAHYYLAKALLREGKAGPALRELRAVPPGDSPIAASAAALADSVTRLGRR
jgi:hypothetical protein